MGIIWQCEAYSRTFSPHPEHECSTITLLASIVRTLYARGHLNLLVQRNKYDQGRMK